MKAPNRLALRVGEAARAIGHHALALRAADLGAQVRALAPGREAEDAVLGASIHGFHIYILLSILYIYIYYCYYNCYYLYLLSYLPVHLFICMLIYVALSLPLRLHLCI